MGQYLDTFNGILKTRQAEQILKLLNKQKETGAIRTVQEFRDRLDLLIQNLSQSVATPSLQVYQAATDHVIDADSFNFMLDRVHDDLSAAFEEANTISQVQEAHTAVVRDVILKNLQYGIAELESKVDLYKFLNTDKNGFDTALFSTFRESKEQRTTRSVDQSAFLFTDPKVGDIIATSQDASVDLVGERLTLGTELSSMYDIRSIRQIFDATAPQSELIVEPPNTNLENVIDGTTGTYWIQTVLLKDARPSIKLKLQLDLAATKDINLLQIEPAVLKNLILESVDYIDGNNIVTNLVKPELTILSPAKLSFRTVTTKSVILTFRNENYQPIQFEYTSGSDTLFNQSFLEPPQGLAPSLQSVATDLDALLASAKIKDVIGLSTTSPGSFHGYAFTTGFDNIKLGISTYTDRSIYLTAPLNVNDIRQVAIKSAETRPVSDAVFSDAHISTVTYDLLDTDFPHGSIEYYIFKRDFDSNGNILSTIRFPILPLNATRIDHERLVLVEKSLTSNLHNDIGYLNFFTDQLAGIVRVYRNGTELPFYTGTSVTDGWIDGTTSLDRTPDQGAPMKFRIQIQQPAIGDIYTATYTPMTCNTLAVPKTLNEWATSGAVIVDLIGDLSARIMSTNVTVLEPPANSDKIASSQIFLGIILRNNTANATLTPAVEEYTLTAGHKDDAKFAGFES